MSATLEATGQELLEQWSSVANFNLWGETEEVQADALEGQEAQAAHLLSLATGTDKDELWEAAARAFEELEAGHAARFQPDARVPPLQASVLLRAQVKAKWFEAAESKALRDYVELSNLLKVAVASSAGADNRRSHALMLTRQGLTEWAIGDLLKDQREARYAWLKKASSSFWASNAAANNANALVERNAKVFGVDAQALRDELKDMGTESAFAFGTVRMCLALMTKATSDFEVAARALESVVPECKTPTQRAMTNMRLGLAAHHAGGKGEHPAWLGTAATAFRDAGNDQRLLGNVAMEALCFEKEGFAALVLAKDAKESSRWKQSNDAFVRSGALYESINEVEGADRVKVGLAAVAQGHEVWQASREFDSPREDVLDEEGCGDDAQAGSEAGREREGTGPITSDQPAVDTPVDAGADFASAVGALRSRLVPTVPKITREEIAELQQAIERAQTNPPDDRATFVENVNAVLDTHGLRLRLEDGALARLKLVNTSSKGTIQLGLPGDSRGFRRASFELVLMSEMASEASPSPL